MAEAAMRKVAARVHRDPSAATIEDIRKLAAYALIKIDGKLPGRMA